MPLFRLGEWAEKAGVADYYGLQGNQLNDDLLGRGLERIQQHVDPVQAGLVLNAVRGWKVDVSEVHYDITTAELFGAYESNDGTMAEGETPPGPRPTYGRTKSGRKNVKQIQVGVNVTGDGGIPVAHVPLDGNTAESSTHIPNMRRLAQLLGRSDLLFIGDTKQDSKETLLEAKAHGGEFLCGGVFSIDLQQYFLRHRRKLRPVAYWPHSQDELPPEKRDRYEAFERTDRLAGTVDGRAIKFKYRTIFVWSEARQQAKTRERHVAKIREEFKKVQGSWA